jgi:hypothetical protein
LPLLSAACASRGAAAPPPAGDGITAAEIEKIPAASAFDVIQRLRPEFLRSRARIPGGTAESGAPLVYVDGIRAGGLDVLRTIAARDVHEIRRLSAPDATTRYGPGHSSGVIEITMRD